MVESPQRLEPVAEFDAFYNMSYDGSTERELRFWYRMTHWNLEFLHTEAFMEHARQHREISMQDSPKRIVFLQIIDHEKALQDDLEAVAKMLGFSGWLGWG